MFNIYDNLLMCITFIMYATFHEIGRENPLQELFEEKVDLTIFLQNYFISFLWLAGAATTTTYALWFQIK